jgi:ferredoxin
VESTLCRECEACLDACDMKAIAMSPQAEVVAEAARLPAQRPGPEVIEVRTQSAPVTLRARLLPAVGAALAWAGPEIVLRLVDVLLGTRDHRATRKQVTASGRRDGVPAQGSSGKGRQHRHRRRGSG